MTELSLSFRRTIRLISENLAMCRCRKKSIAWPLTLRATESMRPSRKRMGPLRQKSRSLKLFHEPERHYGEQSGDKATSIFGRVRAVLPETGIDWLRRPDCPRRLYA